MKVINKILIYRILLSPIVLLWGLFITCVMMFFPIPLLVLITSIQLIIYPFILLFNKVGSNIEIDTPFVNDTKSTFINYIITITIPFWGMFAIVIYFIKTGKLWTGNEE